MGGRRHSGGRGPDFRNRRIRGEEQSETPGAASAPTQNTPKKHTMKTSEFFALAISSLFLISQRLFAPAHSRALGATAGAVTADLALSTDDSHANRAVGAEIPRATVGAIVASVIAESPSPLRIVVKSLYDDVRTVKAGELADITLAAAIGGGGRLLDLTRDLVGDETEPSKVAPWTVANGPDFDAGSPEMVAMKAAIVAMLAPAKPRFSLASLISKLEDLESENFPAIPSLVVDQDGDGKVHVLGDNSGLNAATAVTIIQDTTPVLDAGGVPLPFE